MSKKYSLLFLFFAVTSFVIGVDLLWIDWSNSTTARTVLLIPSPDTALENNSDSSNAYAVESKGKKALSYERLNKENYELTPSKKAMEKMAKNGKNRDGKVEWSSDKIFAEKEKLSSSASKANILKETRINDGNFIIPLLILPKNEASSEAATASSDKTNQITSRKGAIEDKKKESDTKSAPVAKDKSQKIDAPPPKDMLSLSYPTHLRSKDTAYIRLEYGQMPNPPSIVIAEGDEKALEVNPDFADGIKLMSDLCKPGTLLTRCFPDHDVHMSPELNGVGFEIDSSSANQIPRSLKSSYKQWWWYIKPKEDVEGVQNLTLELNFIWSKGKHNIGPEYTVPATLKITVEKPYFDTAPIRIAEIVLFALTIFCTTTFIPKLWKKTRAWYGQWRNKEIIEIDLRSDE